MIMYTIQQLLSMAKKFGVKTIGFRNPSFLTQINNKRFRALDLVLWIFGWNIET